MQLTKEQLIQKYNVPAPRYTSYPTVPYWDKQKPETDKWLQDVHDTFKKSNEEKGISLYIHLPFCESLCTYCGCNTRITKNHTVEETYIEAVLQEWNMYVAMFGRKPLIRELHLGGGTPTFFSAANLCKLIEGILDTAAIHPQHEFSFEGHPNNTTAAHLQTLYDSGFRRVSLGIQDFDEKVQKTINRIQPFSNVKSVTEQARKIGYASINFDLIYGLPFQTLSSIAATIDKVALLMPDRIAFYSYAHVPWIRPGQRSYTEKELPDNSYKRALYETGLEKLSALGYEDIGMDHFALPSDTLSQAKRNKTLHRNFMGYTTCATDLLIGLGASSISDAKQAYVQNVKKVEDYVANVAKGELALFKGHLLSEEDQLIRKCILSIACKGEVEWEATIKDLLCAEAKAQLSQMAEEGLLTFSENRLLVTQAGKAFIRNICMVFDLRHREGIFAGEQVFSKAI